MMTAFGRQVLLETQVRTHITTKETLKCGSKAWY